VLPAQFEIVFSIFQFCTKNWAFCSDAVQKTTKKYVIFDEK
jgi:hypothetical protein